MAPVASVAAPAAAPAADSVTRGGHTPAAARAPAAAGGPGTEVPMPQMGESITEGTITKWLKKVGETVQRDEPMFEISTDKVDAEIPSPVAGVLSEIKVPRVRRSRSTPWLPSSAARWERLLLLLPLPKRCGCRSSLPPRLCRLPRRRRRAGAFVAAGAEDCEGQQRRSEPGARNGFVGTNYKEGHRQPPGARKTSGGLRYPPSAAACTWGGQACRAAPLPGELVPMTKMRSIIARRMVESKHTSPHVHTIFKVDMTRIVRIREKEKSKYEQRNGVKLTYMPFITRAAIVALRKHPIVNGSVEGDAIRYNKNINIGIAVALEWGLIVPVIKQAEEKNFLGIARAIVDVAGRARGKKLAPDEISGGTFTLTNSGIFGEQFGLPIINQPQSAILGIGGMNKEAEVVTDADGNDSIAIRSIQRFSLGFDHRIVDGADAGKFMSDFKAYLENWSEDIGYFD